MSSQHTERARILLGQARYEMAERELREAASQNPDDPLVHALLAIALTHQEGKRDAALYEGRMAVHLAPDFPYAHYVLAHVYSDQNKLREAEAAVREAIRLNADDADYYALLSSVTYQQSRWQDARTAAETALSLEADHVGAANLRAMTLVKLGLRDEAQNALVGALSHDPDNALTHANRGWATLERGNHAEAMGYFKEALRLEPENDWARQGILESLRARNPIYRVMLRYFFWMAKLPPQVQWGVIVGGWFGQRFVREAADRNPALKPFLYPLLGLYFLFVFLTWTAKPLFNLLLRLDKFGRLTLSRDQIIASNWVGGCLLVAVVCAALSFPLGSPALFLTAGAALLLLIPVSGTFSAQNKTSRLLLALWTGALGAAALACVALFAMGRDDAASTAGTCFVVGFTAYVWLGNALISRR